MNNFALPKRRNAEFPQNFLELTEFTQKNSVYAFQVGPINLTC
jgi:hypothetical protein